MCFKNHNIFQALLQSFSNENSLVGCWYWYKNGEVDQLNQIEDPDIIHTPMKT